MIKYFYNNLINVISKFRHTKTQKFSARKIVPIAENYIFHKRPMTKKTYKFSRIHLGNSVLWRLVRDIQVYLKFLCSKLEKWFVWNPVCLTPIRNLRKIRYANLNRVVDGIRKLGMHFILFHLIYFLKFRFSSEFQEQINVYPCMDWSSCNLHEG